MAKRTITFDDMIDLVGTDLEEVEVKAVEKPDGVTLWVNVDGICALRICRVPIDKFSLSYTPRVKEGGAFVSREEG